jgi:elongation factor G
MKNIRNIALVGASGSGKTSLSEQLLNNAKATTRIGKVEDGNTVMDYSAEEIEKGMSMSLSLAHLNWKKKKINLIDTPGYADFCGDQIAAATVAENLLFVVNATSGFEVGLEQALELHSDRSNAKAIVVNRMDNENADYNKTLEMIRENTEINPVPLIIPIGAEHQFKGVIDIVKGKAYIDGTETDIPADMIDLVEELKMSLMESVAESDDALLEKFFEEGELSGEELAKGLKFAIAEGKIIPVFACSATHNIGVNELLDAIVEYLPSPNDKNKFEVLKNDENVEYVASEDGELFAFIFKSLSDPIAGDIAFVRVFSGKLKSGIDVEVPEHNLKERIGSVSYIMGKSRKDSSEIAAGDIGGLVKLKNAKVYNSLVKQGLGIRHQEIELPSPVYWQAIKAVNQHDEDKIGEALTKLLDEDPTIQSIMNAETSENVLSAIGEQQLTLIQKKLKTRFKIEANLTTPSVLYKETIQGKADVSYKHKKQSGGKGQYGEVYLRVSPTERGEGVKFVNSVVGGTIPSKYIPAIEKGMHEIFAEGIISGNPVVDVCVDAYFGSYHDVDSSEMAFKIATWQCLKKAFEVAKPILLEPIHEVKVIIPNEYMGDVMGDISTRRGKIAGMEQKGKKQVLNAHMPLSELFNYYPALKSLTQGRGRFIQNFSHYEKVPSDVAKKVIAEANKED